MKKNSKKLYLVSNAHLDTQWNWTVRDTIRECIKNTLDDNFALLEKYPAYRMNFEGAFRYRLAKEYYPEKYERMKKYIAEGRWNVAGSTWDAMDVNIPSSEALMRQVLLGNGFFEREFGKKSYDIFLTDCFGFRYALPSIAAHMGLLGFSTQKLDWGVGSPVLHTDGSASAPLPGRENIRMDLGRWTGPDGNGIFVSLLEGNYTYNFENDGDTPIYKRREYLKAIEHNEKYAGCAKRSMYFGTGDYGGACSESSAKMLQEAVDANGSEEALFETVAASTDQIFLELTDEEKAALPVYDGHLLIPHGYGAMTSHTISKRLNRKAELLADTAERLSIMAMLYSGAEYPKEQLRGAWELLLWHQFHDDLPGTAIGEAYEITYNDYAASLNLFASELRAAAGELTKVMDTQAKGLPVAIFNPLNVSSNDPITLRLPSKEANAFYTVYSPDGQPLPTDCQKDGLYTRVRFVPTLPPLSMGIYDLRKEACQTGSTVQAGKNFLENSYLRAEINEKGDVCRIYDKKRGRELLSAPIRLSVSPDTSTVWPSWELKYEDFFSPPRFVEDVISIEFSVGKAEASLTINRRYKASSFTQVLRLGAESRRLDVENHIQWYEQKSLLRAVFPLAVSNETALFDQGLGAVSGGNTTSYPYFQHNVHQWAKLTDSAGGFGVAILNDCKYGMEKPSDNTLSLTLIHTPEGEFSSKSGQNFQDMGRNDFTFSVFPYTENDDVAAEAARLNQAAVSFGVNAHPGNRKEISLLSECEKGLLVRCVKQEEKGNRLILRIQECDGIQRKNRTLKLALPILNAMETDGYEEDLCPASFNGTSLNFSIGRYGVKTFALTLENASSVLNLPKPRYMPLPLPFDRKVTSKVSCPTEGSLADTLSIPEELFAVPLPCGGVPFSLGEADKANALICKGQKILLPEGSERVSILCASVSGDKPETVYLDGKAERIVVPDALKNVGAWDLIVRQTRPLLKKQEIGKIFTHLHDSKEPNVILPYRFAYLFKFTFECCGIRTLTLPDDPDILLFAVTADRDMQSAAPLCPLYDEADKETKTVFRLNCENCQGSGKYAAGIPVLLHAALLDANSVFERFERGDGETVQSVGSCVGFFRMPSHNLSIRAVRRRLGENILLNLPCTASGSMGEHESPAKALNGSCHDKWCADSNENGECILTVDLPERTAISGYTVCHCGAFEGRQWNTDSFFLEYRDGKTDWLIADAVCGNRDNITTRSFAKIYATAVRLRITKPTSTKDTHCRIYQFHVYKAEN